MCDSYLIFNYLILSGDKYIVNFCLALNINVYLLKKITSVFQNSEYLCNKKNNVKKLDLK